MTNDYRQQSRVRWATSARGWEERADALRRATMPVSAWMLDALAPQPGQTLLELAAGIGDTGFLAAELLEPGGTLICSDFVPEMISAAQRRADALGVRNVRFRQVDAEVIDEDAASLDGVLCRWGYMLMADPAAALKETRRVLRPGGRLVLAAWTGPEDNRWSSVPSRELVRRGLLEPPDPDAPGQFAWAEEGAVAEQLEAAGFVDFEVAAVDFTMSYASAQDWWDATRALSMRFDDAVAGLDEATADDIRASLAPEGGPLDVPARTWVAAATG